MGKAGIRPTGDDRFTSSFEPWRDWQRAPAPGYMFLYTYWMDMTQSRAATTERATYHLRMRRLTMAGRGRSGLSHVGTAWSVGLPATP